MIGELLAFHLSNFVSFSTLEAANMMLRVNDETHRANRVCVTFCVQGVFLVLVRLFLCFRVTSRLSRHFQQPRSLFVQETAQIEFLPNFNCWDTGCHQGNLEKSGDGCPWLSCCHLTKMCHLAVIMQSTCHMSDVAAGRARTMWHSRALL